MASAHPSTRSGTPPDDLDDILNGIIAGGESEAAGSAQKQPSSYNSRKGDTTGSLGIDEEVIITKKRTPIPKLNDERLLSNPGIPRLQRISKERLKFKGKGHEVLVTIALFFATTNM